MDSMANERLSEFANGNSVAVFDFDGTLAPIVTNRDLARMRKRTHALLTRLCALYPCGVVSGRGLTDVLQHLEGVPIPIVFGSHGLEPGPNLEQHEQLMTAVRTALSARFGHLSGVEVEDKRYSLAVHYRRARRRVMAHEYIVGFLDQLQAPIRVVEGLCVVNIVPKGAPNKADAVRAIQNHFNAAQVLYVGDDVTDEDVFRYSTKPAWLGVRVESSLTTAADFFLCRQREIDWLLARLIRLRQTKRRTLVPRSRHSRALARH